MRFALIAICLMFLSGCNTLYKVQSTDVPVPANLLTRCEGIPNIKDKANMGDLMKYSIELMSQYNECAVRHDGLVEAVSPKKKTD